MRSFGHPTMKKHKSSGHAAAARSSKTPPHLRAHQAKLAGINDIDTDEDRELGEPSTLPEANETEDSLQRGGAMTLGSKPNIRPSAMATQKPVGHKLGGFKRPKPPNVTVKKQKAFSPRMAAFYGGGGGAGGKFPKGNKRPGTAPPLG